MMISELYCSVFSMKGEEVMRPPSPRVCHLDNVLSLRYASLSHPIALQSPQRPLFLDFATNNTGHDSRDPTNERVSHTLK
ncbi:Protein of unknown function [Pyronema omphalodes CBS 100304]|uniref:Uncharacterized protein n=1 Tax=Pyronema omphalodes (strain CBS 100304) TaxID=1076935 RepID=U4LJM1_PYROM|nr:Protein of unknown function [Pyronema omphalodes CBS 100304]